MLKIGDCVLTEFGTGFISSEKSYGSDGFWYDVELDGGDAGCFFESELISLE